MACARTAGSRKSTTPFPPALLPDAASPACSSWWVSSHFSLVFVYFLRYSDDPHEFKKVQKDDIVKDKRMKTMTRLPDAAAVGHGE